MNESGEGRGERTREMTMRSKGWERRERMGARMSSPCGIARAPPGKKSFCTSTRMRAVLRVGDDMVEKREGQVGGSSRLEFVFGVLSMRGDR